MDNDDINWFQDHLASLLGNNGIQTRRISSDKYERLNYRNLDTGEQWSYRRGYGCVELIAQEVAMIHLVGMTGFQKRVHPTWVRYILDEVGHTATFWIEGRAERSGLFGLGRVTNFHWAPKDGLANFSLSEQIIDRLNSDYALKEALLSTGHRRLQLGQATDSHGAPYGYIWAYETQAHEIANFVLTANLIGRNVRRIAGK